jgi:Mg-chelatase subunit ChlD
MSGWKIEFLLIGIILLIGTASAVMPNKITITSSADSDSHNGWLVANGVDQTTITIKVENLSLSPPPTWEPVDLANVILSVDPLYGSFTVTNPVTNGVGEATTVFRANKTPIENLVLNVTVSNTEGTTSSTKIIKIDHDEAYYAYFEYKDEVVIDQTTPFVVTLKDRWGNRVDNKNPNKIHIVKFHIYPPPGGLGTGGFLNGTVYSPYILGVTDIQGNISLTAKVDTVAGENNIWMERIESVPDQYPFIVGIAESVPFTIDQEFDPTAVPNPFLPADNVKKFTIKYTLHDLFGNPAGNQSVYISTSVGENLGNITTNSVGEVWVTYGPRGTSANVNITAIALANTSVSCSQVVEFRSTAPINMLLTANPETMPSLDVKSDMVSDINAKVMDISGNPVAGETVSFSLGTVTYDGNSTAPPYLMTASGLSDEYGFASVHFVPGAFVADPDDSDYIPTASGSADILATWANISRSIKVYWKNYPYLSVKTYVVPPSVALNETFDVTIELYGDGYKMTKKPIDVVVVSDRSGSMAGTKIANEKIGNMVIINNLTANDRVGLVSIDSVATVDSVLKYASPANKSAANTTVQAYFADANTDLRDAIYYSTKMIRDNPRAGTAKAIVLLTDGEYNNGGNPEGGAGASNLPTINTTSVITWTNQSGIKMFIIGLGVTPAYNTLLNSYATKTNGKYYAAPNASQLASIYADISMKLQEEAGVNTTMELKFENVSVNNITVPGGNVFKYIYVNGISTHITNNTYDGTIDQTADWNDDQNLYFDIGTVHMRETWKGTFRLKAIYAQGGNVNIFGSNSLVSFNNNEATLLMPQTWVTIIPNLTNIGINSTTLDLSNLHSTAPGVIKDYIPLEWQINYNGNETVTERISYSNTGGYTWVLFDTNYITKGVFTDYSSLDVRLLPPGEYWIRVDASAPDAPNDREELLAPVTVGTSGRSYIKLE